MFDLNATLSTVLYPTRFELFSILLVIKPSHYFWSRSLSLVETVGFRRFTNFKRFFINIFL